MRENLSKGEKKNQAYLKVLKGQLISKCPFGVIFWTKKTKISAQAAKKRSNQTNKGTLYRYSVIHNSIAPSK